MDQFYSMKMAEFVKKLRDAGHSWPDVEDKFEKKFGEHKSPSNNIVQMDFTIAGNGVRIRANSAVR